MVHYFNHLFVPGYFLSPYESHVREFGQMKFKVRIIKKLARYGIKIYVEADAETASVIKSIVSTGKSTIYSSTTNPEDKATMWVVKLVCEPFTGTYRTIYIDKFYTSISLLRELYDMLIFATSTCMNNRIPKELKMIRRYLEYKEMSKGDTKKIGYV